MRHILLVTLIGLITCFGAKAQEPTQTPTDCKKFHDGKFIIKDPVAGHSDIIVRHKNIQIEHLQGKKGYMKFKVEWPDDCTYTLKMIKCTGDGCDDMPKDAIFTAHIYATTANSYKIRSRFSTSAIEYEYEIFKVK
ncbi:MAG TPA: hypothetical protein VG603_02295 [Chitinophagales bacterium]|nr:hypothetical protein [Chitinophagales bacterium]